MFYDRYVKLCASVGKSPSAVAVEVGIGKSNVTYWKTGRNSPTDLTMQKLADYFGVSLAYLKGEEEQKENLTTIASGEVDDRINNRWGLLTEQEKELFLAQIDAVLKLRGQ